MLTHILRGLNATSHPHKQHCQSLSSMHTSHRAQPLHLESSCWAGMRLGTTTPHRSTVGVGGPCGSLSDYVFSESKESRKKKKKGKKAGSRTACVHHLLENSVFNRIHVCNNCCFLLLTHSILPLPPCSFQAKLLLAAATPLFGDCSRKGALFSVLQKCQAYSYLKTLVFHSLCLETSFSGPHWSFLKI